MSRQSPDEGSTYAIRAGNPPPFSAVKGLPTRSTKPKKPARSRSARNRPVANALPANVDADDIEEQAADASVIDIAAYSVGEESEDVALIASPSMWKLPAGVSAMHRLLRSLAPGRTHADCQQAVPHPCSPSLVRATLTPPNWRPLTAWSGPTIYRWHVEHEAVVCFLVRGGRVFSDNGELADSNPAHY